MASAITSTDRFRHARHVVSVTQGSQAVLLDTRECRYHTLNEVGTRLWQLLSDGPDLRAVVDTICSEYDAAADRVEKDVIALLNQLRSAGFVNVERRSLPIIDN